MWSQNLQKNLAILLTRKLSYILKVFSWYQKSERFNLFTHWKSSRYKFDLKSRLITFPILYNLCLDSIRIQRWSYRSIQIKIRPLYRWDLNLWRRQKRTLASKTETSKVLFELVFVADTLTNNLDILFIILTLILISIFQPSTGSSSVVVQW